MELVLHSPEGEPFSTPWYDPAPRVPRPGRGAARWRARKFRRGGERAAFRGHPWAGPPWTMNTRATVAKLFNVVRNFEGVVAKSVVERGGTESFCLQWTMRLNYKNSPVAHSHLEG